MFDEKKKAIYYKMKFILNTSQLCLPTSTFSHNVLHV